MSRPRLFSFFNRAPDASALIPPPFSVTTGLKSEPPLVVTSKQITDPWAEMLSLQANLASVTAERDQAQAAYTAGLAQYKELEESVVTLKASVAGLESTITGLTAERDTAKAEAARTREDVAQEIRNTELATLAAAQGIPAGTELVPANSVPEKTRDEEINELTEKLAACTSPTERFELTKQARALIMKK